jgi:3-deoxy-7-phosphoheptulonate synthase
MNNNPSKLVDLNSRPERSIIDVSGIKIGGQELLIIAGPCSVESKEQLLNTAKAVKTGGAHMLRGGVFKPRTSPYSFQGLQEEGLELLSWIRQETGLPVVTEVMDTRKVEMVCEHADILQVGSRNMHNTPLLNEVSLSKKPILLKRGMSATIEEFLFAAEFILKNGNDQVILCERGIRTYENSTRFTLDLGAIPMLKRLCHLPVIADPSHGTGHWWMVPSLAKAAIAAGADGLMLEVHHDPDKALCDGDQSLHPDKFHELMKELKKISLAVGRDLSTTSTPNFK